MPETEFTIVWYSKNHEEYSELDTSNCFPTLKEAQKDIINTPIIDNAYYYIAEVNKDNGEVIDSWSVTDGEIGWNEKDSTDEIKEYIRNLNK